MPRWIPSLLSHRCHGRSLAFSGRLGTIAQNTELGLPSDYDEVLASVQRRDGLDSTRKISPLRPAEDAHQLDSSELNLDETVAAVAEVADRVLADERVAAGEDRASAARDVWRAEVPGTERGLADAGLAAALGRG